jgi:unsaturated chondroitin disaccharide hydrolase
MNLELLFWAAKNGVGESAYKAAVSHAYQTAKHQFRDDYTTYHVVNYDSTTGLPIRKFTWQGYKNESVWSRGQAWVIYGFTFCYRETKDVNFLIAAKNAANWFIQNSPQDGIPYWDFNAPYIPNEERDASSACIVAAALLELCQFVKPAEQKFYFKHAEKLLQTLSRNYTSKFSVHSGIIEHSVGGKPYLGELDYVINYADYYYLEALIRYKNSSLRKKFSQ